MPQKARDGHDGVNLPDDTFVRSSFLPPVEIAELFRRSVLCAFARQGLLVESVAQNMQNWPHSGFHVHLGPVIHGEDKEQLKQTARYSVRAPLARSRLKYDREREEVSYTYTNPYDKFEYTEKITPYELIARLVTHVPDPWEHTTSYSHSKSTMQTRVNPFICWHFLPASIPSCSFHLLSSLALTNSSIHY